jgi:hypothetical protein
MLDELHLWKVGMADEVLVIDPPAARCGGCGEVQGDGGPYCRRCGSVGQMGPFGPYVGASTRREIAHAEALGKPVRYLSREGRDA